MQFAPGLGPAALVFGKGRAVRVRESRKISNRLTAVFCYHFANNNKGSPDTLRRVGEHKGEIPRLDDAVRDPLKHLESRVLRLRIRRFGVRIPTGALFRRVIFYSIRSLRKSRSELGISRQLVTPLNYLSGRFMRRSWCHGFKSKVIRFMPFLQAQGFAAAEISL